MRMIRFKKGLFKGGRGSILLVAVILMTVSGFSTLSWLSYVTHAQRAAVRDRDRMLAFYAAESGVEQVVDYFNNPAKYPASSNPEEYTSTMATSPFTLSSRQFPNGPNVHPNPYLLFEPYWKRIELNNQGWPVDIQNNIVVDSSGNLIDPNNPPFVKLTTFFDLSGNSKIPTCEIDVEATDDLIFYNPDGSEYARVERIQIINPADFPLFGDPVPNPNLKVITKVVATAVTPRGVRVEVETLLRENPILDLRSPGAIISWASTEFAGQFNVNWGEIWAKGDVPLKNSWNGNNGVPDEVTDPWFKLRSGGLVGDNNMSGFANGAVSGGFSGTALASTAANYYQPFLESTLHSDNVNSMSDYENIYQHDPLDLPDYDYHKWREFFLVNDLPYYFTDSAGTIYGKDDDPNSATYGQIVGKAYDEWFHVDPTDPEYDDLMKRVAFIDTYPTDANGNAAPTDANGVPVRNATYKSREPVDGVNMPEIRSSGTGIHTRGAILLAGHFSSSGGGNPPRSDEIIETELDGSTSQYVLKPDGTAPSGNERFRVNHNGMIFCYGEIRGTGNLTVYGSLFAKQGYEGTGAREVYYNYRMKDGSWLELNQSFVKRMLFDVRTPRGS